MTAVDSPHTVHQPVIRAVGRSIMVSCVCRTEIKPEFFSKGGGGRVKHSHIAAVTDYSDTIRVFNDPDAHNGAFDVAVHGLGRRRFGRK